MFRDVLQEIIDRTDGCLGALIVGLDGITVEKNWNPTIKESELDTIVAEYINI